MGRFRRFWFGEGSFFVRLMKLMRAFINDTTARLRCVWVLVELRSVAYATICCLPHMAIMCHHERGSKDVLRPHTLRYLLVEDVHFYSLDRRSEYYFRTYVKADFLTNTPLCGLPMGTPWLLVSAYTSIFCARKKNELTTNTYATSSRFFRFSTYPHACMRA